MNCSFRPIAAALLFAMSAFLAACGGGGGGGGGGVSTQTPSAPAVIPAPNPSDGLNYRSAEFGSPATHYGLSRINADAAYQRRYFGQGVTVGVVDTGVRLTHRELDDAIVPGRDFVFPGTPITDGAGHGTGVAAVIGGKKDDVSMHGVAPRAWIMPLKIGDSAGNIVGNSREALRYAINRRVPIINASFNAGTGIIGNYQGASYFARVPFFRGFSSSAFRSLAREFAGIVRNRDTVVVWAAGNGGWNSETGMVQLQQCGPVGAPLAPENCQGSPISISRNAFVAGFNSLNYFDNLNSRNVILGHGLLSTVDGTGATNVPSFNSLAPLYAVSGADQLIEDFSTGAINSSTFSSRLTADSNFRAMFGRWLAVVATDRNNRIASFSNGCGLARPWCLAAPGEAIFTANSDSDVGYEMQSGTSFAAPHVSGALAVLKSRLPSMPMSVIVAIMLTTAADLGTPGVDATYGWGLLDLDAAVRYTGRLQLQTASSSGVRLADARINLPAALSHIAPRLADARIAVGGVGDAYYNMPLSDIVRVSAAAKAPLGDAAADMLAAASENRFGAGAFFAATDTKTNQFRYAGAKVSLGGLGAWSFRHDFCDDCEESAWKEWGAFAQDAAVAAPFFARDDARFVLRGDGDGLRPFAAFGGEIHGADDSPYQQFGMRWRKDGARVGVSAEISAIRESQSFLGADFGELGRARANTGQGRIAIRGDFGGGWRGIAMLERARSDVQIADGFLLSEVKGARAEGWRLGVEGGGVFAGGDLLRFSVRRETTIRRGRAVLRHTEADGDFTAAFYRNVAGASEDSRDSDSAQTLHSRQTEIALAGEASTIFAAGYAASPMHNARLAFGLEHDAETGESAASARLQIRF